MNATRERGFEAEEVVAILAQRLGAEGFASRTEIVDATEFRLVVAVGTGQMIAEVKRRPDRVIGPTLRLPVATVATEFVNVDADQQRELLDLIDRSLLRGGG